MKNLFCAISLIAVAFFFSCKTKENNTPVKLTTDFRMLDSIKKEADSIYINRYPRTDYSIAEYYVNKKNSTSTQVMKDSLGIIRQIISTKGNIRIFYAQFYANGQIMAKYSLDGFGQFDGYCKEYFENGFIKSEGHYSGGLHIGNWKNYDNEGNLISIFEYNKDGQVIKSKQ